MTDVLIIGAGIAGAAAALRLARDSQRSITLLTRADEPEESNSRWAQGGIVGRGNNDAQEILMNDILEAGSGLCLPEAVEVLSTEGPEVLERVLVNEAGVAFERDHKGGYIFGMEAAHSRRRILHVGDFTGRAIMAALHERIRQSGNIEVIASQTAVDLITFPHHSKSPLSVYQMPTCHGAYVFDQHTGHIAPLLASQTILATGGLGQIYLNTTNPAGSRGDGLAMGYRAGTRVINAEFIQFHPTALHMAGSTKFLISEAVRGEGGVLLTPDGRAFMQTYSPEWKDLAARDVVSRAIYWEMIENGYSYVLLDLASNRDAEFIKERFPQIYTTCLKQGLDITQQPIPVVPAAHYFCGGILVDLWGQTNLPGLYAVGEVSCTGVHGANRLASTSLLEGLVWGDRAARHIQSQQPASVPDPDSVPIWDLSRLEYDSDPALISGDMQNIRNLMWHYVGLVRSEYRLKRAVRELRHLWLEIEEFYRKTRLTDGLIGLRNAAQCAIIVAQAARRNHISIGAHYRDDQWAQ